MILHFSHVAAAIVYLLFFRATVSIKSNATSLHINTLHWVISGIMGRMEGETFCNSEMRLS